MFKKLLIPFLLLCSHAYGADHEFTFKYGLGFGVPSQNNIAEVKLFELGYQGTLFKILKHKIGLGVWADSRNDVGRSSSGYGSYSLGIKVEPSIFYLESFWGVAAISSPDIVLAGYFQFTQDLGIGVKDDKGRFIGLSYKHFSNAGIKQPNIGRDFFLINVGAGF